MNKIVFGALTLIPSIAFAQNGDSQAFWQVVLNNLVEILAVVVTPLVIVLARKLVRVIEHRTNVDIDERYDVLLDEWVRKGVSYAEEQAHKALKSDKPINSDDKKAVAVEFVVNAAKEAGWVKLGADKVAQLVEAQLGDSRKSPKP